MFCGGANMAKSAICCKCHQRISSDVLALNMKLLGRHTRGVMCLECLADYLNTERTALTELILDLKEQGCSLFLDEY
jgi:hypothetical protein